MAGIQTGSGEGHAKRSVDHEIPLVPFIDLLLCCVMFLLVTAVWNHLSAVQANMPGTGGGEDGEHRPPPLALSVRVAPDRYVLQTTGGNALEVARHGDASDRAALGDRVRELRGQVTSHDVILASDDGVHYDELVDVMDVLMGSGFSSVSVASP